MNVKGDSKKNKEDDPEAHFKYRTSGKIVFLRCLFFFSKTAHRTFVQRSVAFSVNFHV